MTIAFLHQLFETGHISVEASESVPAEASKQEAYAVLADVEDRHRLSLPGVAPAWNADVSLWAAQILFDACRALVHREITADDINRLLSAAPPASGTPSACYSADLVFRVLGELIRLASGRSTDDPLTTRLMDLGRAWPLSSVGIPNLGAVFHLDGFISDRSLRRAYAERIVSRNDIARLDHPAVRDELRTILGAYPHLGRDVARRLAEQDART